VNLDFLAKARTQSVQCHNYAYSYSQLPEEFADGQEVQWKNKAGWLAVVWISEWRLDGWRFNE